MNPNESSAQKTFYNILEVSRSASQAVIRAAYKSLLQHFHPDKHLGKLEMGKQAQSIREAFDVLSDPEKRREYDLTLKQ